MKLFVGDTLQNVQTEKGGCPVSFTWKNQEYRVKTLLKQWHDFDYSPLAPKRDWRSRRHRNYFQVETDFGECFELYCDRGTKLGAAKHWILHAVLIENERNR
jgi:hypothetical protein